MYPKSMAFPDSFLVTKAVDIPVDDNASPAGNKDDASTDLRACLGEATPKRLSRSASLPRRRDADPKKHWSKYYKAAMTSGDSPEEEGMISTGNIVSLRLL